MVDKVFFKVFLLKINLRACFVESGLKVISAQFCSPSLSTRFFINKQVAKGLRLKMIEKLSNLLSNLNVKNATAKNFFVEFCVKIFTFSIFSSLKLNVSTIVFDTT